MNLLHYVKINKENRKMTDKNQKAEQYKEKINNYLGINGYYSLMNNTKWRRLLTSISILKFPPAYCIKRIFTKKIEELNRKPTYWGDWSYENFYPFFDIELLQITPYYYKYQGKLIDDREIDETEDMITLLEKCRIFYEQKQKIIIIYDYKKNH